MLFLGLILSILVATVGMLSCVTLKRKFAKGNPKTPSVSTLIRRFDTIDSRDAVGTTVTAPPKRAQTKTESRHVKNPTSSKNRNMTGAPSRSLAHCCSESSRGYEPPVEPNELEHSYRDRITSEHLYIELLWWHYIFPKAIIHCWITFVCKWLNLYRLPDLESISK